MVLALAGTLFSEGTWASCGGWSSLPCLTALDRDKAAVEGGKRDSTWSGLSTCRLSANCRDLALTSFVSDDAPSLATRRSSSEL